MELMFAFSGSYDALKQHKIWYSISPQGKKLWLEEVVGVQVPIPESRYFDSSSVAGSPPNFDHLPRISLCGCGSSISGISGQSGRETEADSI